MDRRSMIGLFLILALFLIWQQVIAPTPEELEAQQRTQDSLARVEQQLEEVEVADEVANSSATANIANLSDSARVAQFGGVYGPFAMAVGGETQEITLENDLMQVKLSSKGGKITDVQLKNYKKMRDDEEGEAVTSPLHLLNNPRNKFGYSLPIASVPSGAVNTSDLNFQVIKEGSNTVIFRAPATGGAYFEQRYSLKDGSYLMDYDLKLEGLNNVISANADQIKLNWVNHLERVEKNASYEANLTTIYYKPMDDASDHCSCTGNDEELIEEEKLKWVSNTQQFFTSALFADNGFSRAKLETLTIGEEGEDLKVLRTDLEIPFNRSSSETIGMSFYVGPNEFERMREIGHDFSDVIPYGRSIFGAINRWVIRPIFNFLDGFIGNKGIAILLLTILVKLLVYPLTYKMLVSNTKMQVLKPQIEKLKKKHGEDKQTLQMETMKMYQEYGASPLGGCLPMFLQMPIWFALYRFFPAAITFRQESFLWANDLSSYDTFLSLPFSVPFGFGDHLSLFAFLWAITTLIYAYYNSRHMDFSAQPAMKYMQYFMPIMFLGFFNSFAAGLTCYLLFSNLFNIGQTIITKEVLIDKDKLLTKLEANKAKPKKKSGFTERLQEALKEQQRQAELAKKKKK